MTAQTTAQKIAALMGDDGTQFYAPNGDSLDDLAEGSDATARYGESYYDEEAGEDRIRECGPERHTSSRIRYEFPDGSVIVVAGDAWDFEGETPFSWAGA